MFPAAVVGADLRLVLRLTSYIGTRPVQRHELRDVTTDVGEFRIKIPADLPTIEESWRSAPNASARPSAAGTANLAARHPESCTSSAAAAICVITVGYLRKGRQVARIRSGADQRPNRITSEVRSVARRHRR
jgi:hypothetical protein